MTCQDGWYNAASAAKKGGGGFSPAPLQRNPLLAPPAQSGHPTHTFVPDLAGLPGALDLLQQPAGLDHLFEDLQPANAVELPQVDIVGVQAL